MAESVAAQYCVLLHQDHITAGICSTKRRGTACGTTADDEQIAVAMCVLVVIRIRFPGSRAHPRRFADDLFIAHPHPCAASPFEWRQAHESFVVKPCGEESAEKIVYGAKIKANIWPSVLPAGDEPFVERLGSGSNVGVLLRALAYRDECSGFLHPG